MSESSAVSYIAVISSVRLVDRTSDPNILSRHVAVKKTAHKHGLQLDEHQFFDASQSRKVNFLGRVQFTRAVTMAVEKALPLIVFDLLWLLEGFVREKRGDGDEAMRREVSKLDKLLVNDSVVYDAKTGLRVDRGYFLFCVAQAHGGVTFERLKSAASERHHGSQKQPPYRDPRKAAVDFSRSSRRRDAKRFVDLIYPEIERIVTAKHGGTFPSMSQLARDLNEAGIRARRGGPWSQKQVQRVIEHYNSEKAIE